MDIIFRLDASNQKGTGHFSRCATLADEFVALGHNCTFVCKSDPEIKKLLDTRPFPSILLPKEQTLEKELHYMQNLSTDILILDTYWINDDYISALNHPTRTLCCIDDNSLYTYDCDIILNGNPHALELDYHTNNRVPLFLLGGEYCLIGKQFQNIQHVIIRKKATNIFVCMGGSDLQNFTPQVVLALRDLPEITTHVILGPLTQNDNIVKQLQNSNIQIHKAPSNLPKLMASCDIAITSSGSMIYELCTLGLPVILISQVDNQLIMSDYMHKRKIMECLGYFEDVTPEQIRAASIKLLQDYPRRKREHELLIQTVSSHGAHNAALKITEFAKQKISQF